MMQSNMPIDSFIDNNTPTLSVNKHWSYLLTNRRLGSPNKKQTHERSRTPFHKDYDRLIFSQSFRQLNQKTQVHPLINKMGIHTRLTHSLEVSCIGRSLGMMAAEKLQSSLASGLPIGVSAADVGVIVQAACLAHDIGNPPFGHAGEYAIRDWFNQPKQQLILKHMHPYQRFDLQGYEGNAQGFRLLTRNEHHPDRGGMRLTCATLGAFMKYPWLAAHSNAAQSLATAADNPDSRMPKHALDTPLYSPATILTSASTSASTPTSASTSASTSTSAATSASAAEPKAAVFIPPSLPINALTIKKYGCFYDDANLLDKLAGQLKLPYSPNHDGYARHPLAYLLEAADDICYALIDLEDGIHLNMLDYHEVEPLLLSLIGERGAPPELKYGAPIAQKLAALRGRAMMRLVDKVTNAFVTHANAMLAGELQGSLFDHCEPSICEGIIYAKTLASEQIFSHPSKVRMELMANRCLQTLLDAFMPLALLPLTGQPPHFEQKHLMQLLNQHLQTLHRSLDTDVYNNALNILDFITGMNDHEAYRLAQDLNGVGDGNW